MSSTRRLSSASKRCSWPGAGATVPPTAPLSLAVGATARVVGGAASDCAASSPKLSSAVAGASRDAACSPRSSRERPITPAATSATTAVAGTASTVRRHPHVNRKRSSKGSRTGSSTRSARTRSRSAGGASGLAERISFSSVSDMDAHLLLELLQGSRQPRRDRCGADPEHARRLVAVELEQDAERDHLALTRGELAQRRLELGRQAFDEAGLQPVRHRRALLAAPAAVFGSEPLERRPS